MSKPRYESKDDVCTLVNDGRFNGASEPLLALIETRAWRNQEPINVAVEQLHRLGIDVEGFDAASQREPDPIAAYEAGREA